MARPYPIGTSTLSEAPSFAWRTNGICERLVGIIRRELLDHIIPLNQRHLECLIQEYIQNYYNPVRTHQGIDCQTPILKEAPPGTSVMDTVLTSESILGGLYHSYRKVA